MTLGPGLDSSLKRNLYLLMAGIATVGLQALMLSPMLTDIMAALRVSPAEIGLASGCYGIGVAVSAFLAAPRLDTWPRRQALRASLLVMAAALALCGAAWSWPVLVLGQLAIGAAAGILIPGTYALASELSAESERTQALGRVVLGWSVALCGGVPLSALLTDALGWRMTFFAVAALALVSCLAFALLPEPARSEAPDRVGYREALDAPGALLLLGGTFAFMFGFYATYTFLGDHLRGLHASGAWLGGVVAMTYGLGFGLATMADSWINRFGPAKVVGPALACVGLNYIVLPVVSQAIAAVIVYALLWGVIAHFAMTSLVSALSRSPARVRGALIALFSVTTYVAQAVGGILMGTVYAAYGFAVASWIGAGGAFLMAALVWLDRRNLR